MAKTGDHIPRRAFRIDGRTIDPERNLVSGPDGEVHVEPRVIDLLCVLADQAGKVVSRDELIDLVWAGAFGADHSLNRAVSQLRKALGDRPGDEPLIETVPKRGYRLRARVEALVAPEAGAGEDTAGKPAGPASRNAILAFAGLAALVAVALWLGLQRESAEAPPPAPAERSIAVLPFINLSGDPENEYFSDGLSEEILNSLAGVDGLRVAARTSAFRFKGAGRDAREIARQLNVRAVLEGSVRKSGNRVRITAQLIDAEDGYHLWSQSFDRELGDIFKIQDEIAAAIVDALQLSIAADEALPRRAAAPPTENLEAYDTYLRGRYLWLGRSSVENLRRSAAFFDRAIALDPDFALAKAALAADLVLLPVWEGKLASEMPVELSRARQLVAEALARDPELSLAYAARAQLHELDGDYLAALEDIDRAIALDPDEQTGHIWKGIFLVRSGFAEDALPALERALEIDPVSALHQIWYARALMILGRDEEFLEMARESEGRGNIFVISHPLLYWAESGEYDAMRAYIRSKTGLAKAERGLLLRAADALEDPTQRAAVLEAWQNLPARRDFQQEYQVPLMLRAPEYLFPEFKRLVLIDSPVLTVFWGKHGAWLRQTPEFKEIIREEGIFDFWKARRFPAGCRPLGADDFACD